MRILVADDDEVFTSLIEGCLDHHDVTAVHDGNDVITAFIDGHRLKEPFDIILLDINLPHLTGDKILQRIRKHEKRHLVDEKRAFIAITSGCSDANVIKQSIKDGCDHYFIKPVSIEKITQVLDNVEPQTVSLRYDYTGIALKQ